MKTVEPNARFRKAVRGFYAWLGSVLVAMAAPIVSARLIESGTLTGRVLGVTIGVVGWVPMMIVVAVIITRGDEFQRRIHMTAIAITFAGALLLLSALDWLQRAGFIGPPALSVVWLAIALIWFVMLMATKWRFERQQ